MTTICIYVVDTSYLLELFRVDGCFREEDHQSVLKKFRENVAAGAMIFVPISVLFELANHIADVHDAQRRRTLAELLHAHIKSSIADQNPWVITHATDANTIDDLLSALTESARRFADEFSTQKLGLTDATVILEAERLRKKYENSTLKKYQIHIWTRHQELKAREPDTEASQFV